MIIPEYDENGKLKHNGERYTAIKKLYAILKDAGVDCEMHEMNDGYQICVPADHNPNSFEGDAIQHFGSYGAERDLIEVYGFNLNAPDGHLTTEEAAKYFMDWHEKRKKVQDG